MKKTLWITFIIILILLVLFWLCHIGKLPFCKHDNEPPSWRSYLQIDTNYKHTPADTTQQIIVWRKPGDGDMLINYWLDSIHKATNKEIKITLLCGSCADTNLMLLTGEGIKTFIQSSKGVKGGGTTCSYPPTAGCSGGPGGGGDTVYWCVNFPVEFKDSANTDNTVYPSQIDNIPIQIQKRNPQLPPVIPGSSPGSSNKDIVVAVFDTGVDTLELKNFLYRSNNENCLSPLANNGWNFPDKSPVVEDNYSHSKVGHGQVVARLIAYQFLRYNTSNKIKILPVKIHDSNGEGDLFSVLCGFAYAKNRGANVINASFGYYAVKNMASPEITDPGALLLKSFIKYYLTQNNIWLIAAAGNRNSADNDQSLKDLYNNAHLPLPLGFRNLDSINFYPASLAGDPELSNVIAVTTVDNSSGLVSPNENYSPDVVDIGVNGDLALDGDFWFRNWNEHIDNSYVRGSSFATPIVAGIICAYYNDIVTNVAEPFNKNQVLPYLLKTPIGHSSSGTSFSTKIKQGIMFNNTAH